MANIDVNNKRIAKNTIFLYLRMLLILVVSLYTTRIVLKVLGVENYGIYNVVAGFVSLFGFFNASLTSSIQRFYNYEGGINGERGWQKVLVTALYVEAIFSLLAFALLETLGLWYVSNRLVIPCERLSEARILFQLSTFQMIILMLQAPFSALIMAKEYMNYYAIVGVVEIILRLFNVLIIPYVSYDKLVVFAIINTLITVIVFLMYFIFSIIKFPTYKISHIWDKKIFFNLLSFTGWNIFGSVAMMARTQGVNVLLNAFFGPVVNAARGVAFQIQAAVMGFTQNLTIAVRPQMTDAYAREDYSRTLSLMFVISKVSFVILYMLALPIISETDTILNIWLGESAIEYTSNFTRLILVAALVDVLNSPITIIVMASGNVKIYSLLTSIIGLMVLPISYFGLKVLLIPDVVFIVGIFISLLVQIVSVLVLKRYIKISVTEYCKKIVLPLLCLVGTTIWIPRLIDLFSINVYYNLILTTFLSVAAIAMIALLVVLNKQERLYILTFLKR